MAVKYFIRTTGERELNETYEQISYEKLIDKDHRYVAFFIECLEYFSQWDSVFIEDDVILCRDFKNRIEAAIAEHPNKIINFFTFPYQEYYTTHESTEYLQNQCTYYPKGLAKKLALEMRKVLKQFPDLSTDCIEDKALKNLGEAHIKYRPSLVQHIATDTLLNHFARHMRTQFFIDYLDDLKLDINNLQVDDLIRLRDYARGQLFKLDIAAYKKSQQNKK